MPAFLLSAMLLFGADPTSKPPSVNGSWELDTGYMGITLALKGDTFEYWFYSDVISNDEPKYPIRGKVRYRSNSIVLVPPEGQKVYSTTWRLVVDDGEICLLADHALPDHRPPSSPSGRLLHKVADDVSLSPTKQSPTGK